MNIRTVRVLLVLLLPNLSGSAGAGPQAPTDSIPPTQDTAPETPSADRKAEEDFFEMSIEELMDVEVRSTASLTGTSVRMAPSTMTTITREQIQSSGARSLYELLDIHVPNLQMTFHAAKLRHLGLRGIIETRDDKYLLLVNGRVMNEKTDFGAMTERDLPMLTDIHHIDVVRGPGSALYGPGALSMVINIVTDTPATFQGTQITNRIGAVEEFYSTEFKHSRPIGPDGGLLIYAGAGEYPGASLSDAPVIPGKQVTINGTTYEAGDEIHQGFKRLNGEFDDQVKYKLHGHYIQGPFEAWARFTSGGEHIDHLRYSQGRWWFREGEGYQQATALLGYTQSILEDLSIRYSFSFDSMNVETLDDIWRPKSFQENEYLGRVLARWKPAQNHALALGAEWSHEQFGREHWDGDAGKAVLYMSSGTRRTFANSTAMPRWSTDRKSLVGEYQWNINDQFTAFLGSRLDYHTFTHPMWSPRGALVITPGPQDTFKLMASRSVRTNTAFEMKANHDRTGERTDPEILKAAELRYERQQTQALLIGGGFFYHSHDTIGWGGKPRPLGNVESYGIELEASYRGKKTRIDFSHGYTKMTDYEPGDDIKSVEFTSANTGFGNDLANWDNHVSKLAVHRELTDNWNLDGSVYVYWGSPGAEDYADYRYSVSPGNYESGFDEPFRPSVFLNLGLEYRPSQNLTLRLDGYNLLGLFDQELNKRRVGFNTEAPGQYRVHAPAMGVSLTWRF
jgi:iron complex outermembrane receptor protein